MHEGHDLWLSTLKQRSEPRLEALKRSIVRFSEKGDHHGSHFHHRSSDGLGFMAAQLLGEEGHGVVLHARNEQRADETQKTLPEAETVVVGDLASIAQTRHVADQVNQLGTLDAVIHNAGIGYREPRRIVTEDGLSHLLAVNVLAPYLVTALMTRPDRLVYLSSGMHRGGDPDLSDLQWERRPWDGAQ